MQSLWPLMRFLSHEKYPKNFFFDRRNEAGVFCFRRSFGKNSGSKIVKFYFIRRALATQPCFLSFFAAQSFGSMESCLHIMTISCKNFNIICSNTTLSEQWMKSVVNKTCGISIPCLRCIAVSFITIGFQIFTIVSKVNVLQIKEVGAIFFYLKHQCGIIWNVDMSNFLLEWRLKRNK